MRRRKTYLDAYGNLPRTDEKLKKWQSLQSDWNVYLEANAPTMDILKRFSDERDWRRMEVGMKEFVRYDNVARRQRQIIQSHLDALIELNQTYAAQAAKDGIRVQESARVRVFLMTGAALLLCEFVRM